MESLMPLHISRYKSLACVTVFLLLTGMKLGAQVRNGVQRDNPPSRAELEAEQRVSLSADKLIEILQQEPGLLLQVKKLLVRKAFEQGRLLDPADLTDEALFRLLREDDNIRILTTREVEDREYIRAKPTREELQRTQGMRPPMMPPQAPSQTGDVASLAKKSQEDAYWEQQDRVENFGAGAPNSFPLPSAPIALAVDATRNNLWVTLFNGSSDGSVAVVDTFSFTTVESLLSRLMIEWLMSVDLLRAKSRWVR